MLRDHLPDVDWAPLLTSLGYATGFVILGRQQLFTVNTATVALPVIAGRSWRALGRTGLFALLANARVEDEVRAVDPRRRRAARGAWDMTTGFAQANGRAEY